MPALETIAKEKLLTIASRNLTRELADTARLEGATVVRDGKRFISFSCNDYLGLSQHPDVKKSAVEAVEKYGTSAGASRLVTGNHPLYADLEKKLAKFKGTEAAISIGSGYLANIGVIPMLVGESDVIFADKLVHACIIDGAQLSQARLVRFKHNDVNHLEGMLKEYRAEGKNALIATEGVFSMDGDIAPLPELSALAQKYDAWLLVDDAHATGVIGKDGRGSTHAFDKPVKVDVLVGTLSKALGAYGGFIAGSQELIELVAQSARSLMFSTGLPPASVAAAMASLEVMEKDSAITKKPLKLAQLFTSLLALPEAQSGIVPVIIGDAKEAMVASQRLEELGFIVRAIRPPTVPPGTARLRFTFSAAHQEGDVRKLAEAVKRLSLKKAA